MDRDNCIHLQRFRLDYLVHLYGFSFPFFLLLIIIQSNISHISHKFAVLLSLLAAIWTQEETMGSKRLETAKTFIDQFATLDTQALASILAENHTHQFAPASLNVPGPFDKAGLLAHRSRLRNVLTGFPVTAKEYIESESSNQVTVWATSQTIFRDDAKDDGLSEEEWTYKGEYIFIFSMDETGEKIVRTIEFLDSMGTHDKLLPLMKRANENREKRLAEEGK